MSTGLRDRELRGKWAGSLSKRVQEWPCPNAPWLKAGVQGQGVGGVEMRSGQFQMSFLCGQVRARAEETEHVPLQRGPKRRQREEVAGWGCSKAPKELVEVRTRPWERRGRKRRVPCPGEAVRLY